MVVSGDMVEVMITKVMLYMVCAAICSIDNVSVISVDFIYVIVLTPTILGTLEMFHFDPYSSNPMIMIHLSIHSLPLCSFKSYG